MFSQPAKPLYSNILFAGMLADKSLSSIVETNPYRLNAMVMEILRSKDPEHASLLKAMKLAQKIAIFYGTPGLIQYVNVAERMLSKMENQHDETGQFAFNTLVYLNLTMKLHQYDSETVKKLTASLIPDQLNNDYWNAKKHDLIKLGNLYGRETEAEKVCNELFNSICPQNSIHVKSHPL